MSFRTWVRVPCNYFYINFTQFEFISRHFQKYLGNICPLSLTSLQGKWCLMSGLFIQVWMFTISFLSSSDIEELSISSRKKEKHQTGALAPKTHLRNPTLFGVCWTHAREKSHSNLLAILWDTRNNNCTAGKSVRLLRVHTEEFW